MALVSVVTLATVLQVAGQQVAGAAAPTITAPGYAQYLSGGFVTTIGAASNGASLPQGTITVASTAGFATSYEGLTVQSSAGPQASSAPGRNGGDVPVAAPVAPGRWRPVGS